MAVTGQQCLGLVVQASETFRSGDLEEAQKQLKNLSGATVTLIRKITEKERILNGIDDEKKEEEKVLHRRIGHAEGEIRQQRGRITNLEVEVARMNAVLEDKKQDLRKAENRMQDAKERKEQAVTRTVAGGVATVLLGAIFPPSLVVTVPATAVLGGSIADHQATIDRQRRVISETQDSISSKHREIDRTNSNIRSIECNISTLEFQKRSLEQERGKLRQTIVFLQKAIAFFEELKAATEGGKQRTDLLHRITEKLTARETYSITTSSGCQKMCHSFQEAWGHVEETMNAGEQYLAITWQ